MLDAPAPPAAARRSQRARRVLVWLLMLCLPWQGVGIAAERIVGRLHVHHRAAEAPGALPAPAVRDELRPVGAMAAELAALAVVLRHADGAPQSGHDHDHGHDHDDDHSHDDDHGQGRPPAEADRRLPAGFHHDHHAASSDHLHGASEAAHVVYLDDSTGASRFADVRPHRTVADLETLTVPPPEPTGAADTFSRTGGPPGCAFESCVPPRLERPPR